MECNTVGKLMDQLSKLPAEARIVVCLETDNDTKMFGIDNVSMSRGTPKRLPSGDAAFAFDGSGPANWAFIEISRE